MLRLGDEDGGDTFFQAFVTVADDGAAPSCSYGNVTHVDSAKHPTSIGVTDKSPSAAPVLVFLFLAMAAGGAARRECRRREKLQRKSTQSV